MTQILKRLEIIKSSIAIEDEEVIALQVAKLSQLEIDDDVNQIIAYLNAMDNVKALQDIESYLKKYSGVVSYVDTEVQALKLELKKIESALQELIIEKIEYVNSIEKFNAQYNLHLGELIKTIFNLKKEILYKKTIKQQKAKEKYKENFQTLKNTKEIMAELKDTLAQLEEALKNLDEDDENYDELLSTYEELQKASDALEEELQKTKEFIEDDTIKEQYEELKSQFEEFESEYEYTKQTQKDIINLNNDEKAELKKFYKKAARLCHPDIVPDKLKEKAHELMQQLNAAYSKQDLKAVQKILNSLENGSGFELSSDSINDKKLLKEKIEEYKQHIADTKAEIEAIKEDDTYKTISELDDWDTYFDVLKETLQKEMHRLEEEAKHVLEESSEDENDEPTNRSLSDDVDEIVSITKEESSYVQYIQSIQNPSFEKIRRYCNNLADDQEADEMQKYIAENGKMHKAIIYDALEQFLERLDGKTMTLIDWGCAQGIASMLVLDYIREKQLKIDVDNVFLIDDHCATVSRAMVQVETLTKGIATITAIKSVDSGLLETIKTKQNNITLNLFANDKMPIDFLDIDYDIFQKDYFMCVSNESQEFVDDIYQSLSDSMDIEELSNRDGKIGRFQRYESIFKII